MTNTTVSQATQRHWVQHLRVLSCSTSSLHARPEARAESARISVWLSPYETPDGPNLPSIRAHGFDIRDIINGGVPFTNQAAPCEQ